MQIIFPLWFDTFSRHLEKGEGICFPFQVFSGYRFLLAASERKLPIAIVNIGPTRADHLTDIRVSARCGEVLPAIQLWEMRNSETLFLEAILNLSTRLITGLLEVGCLHNTTDLYLKLRNYFNIYTHSLARVWSVIQNTALALKSCLNTLKL